MTRIDSGRLVCTAAAAISIVAGGAAAIGDDPRFQLSGIPPGWSAFEPVAISADGRVIVGNHRDGSVQAAAIWTPGHDLVELGYLSEIENTIAADINGDGSVAVGTGYSQHGVRRAVRWTAASGWVDIGAPNTTGASEALAVDRTGAVAAGRIDPGIGLGRRAWVWSALLNAGHNLEPLITIDWDEGLTAISADGTVAVGELGPGPTRCVRWEDGSWLILPDLPGGIDWGFVGGVNADGSVVVGHGNTDLDFEAFRWTLASGVEGLGVLDGDFTSFANAVCDDGSVVVGTSQGFGGYRACIWSAGGSARELATVAETEFGIGLGGWTLLRATDVSADGTVVAGLARLGEGPAQGFRLVLAPPEPAGPADVTTTHSNPGDPGHGVPDGQIDGADLSFYVELWLAGAP